MNTGLAQSLFRIYVIFTKYFYLPINGLIVYLLLTVQTPASFYQVSILAIAVNVNHYLYWKKSSKNNDKSQPEFDQNVNTLFEELPEAIPDEDPIEPSPDEKVEYMAEGANAQAFMPSNQDSFQDDMANGDTFELEDLNDHPAIEPNQHLDALTRAMMTAGLAVEKNTLRTLFAGMATTRILYLTHQDALLSKQFIQAFADGIGAQYVEGQLEEEHTTFADFLTAEPAFEACLSMAKDQPNRIHIVVLNQTDMHQFQACFKPIMNQIINPEILLQGETRGASPSVILPKNVWLVIIPNTSELATFELDFLQSSIHIAVRANAIEAVEHDETLTQPKLSYQSFVNMLSKGYETWYLDEADWKKFDRIEAFLLERSVYRFDNPLMRELERFSSTFLMYGGDEKEVIDGVLFAKLLPLIAYHLSKQQDRLSEDLLKHLDALFGLEHLSHSKKLLKHMQATV